MNDKKAKSIATIFAILAAALYAINIPFSKVLLTEVEESMMAAFLYLGAGLGMFLYCGIRALFRKCRTERFLPEGMRGAEDANATREKGTGEKEPLLDSRRKKELLAKEDLPYTVAMVVLDIIAPILLMMGIARTNSANVSLLNNFEIVATSLIALFIFKEVISKKLWLAIGLVTAASVILSFEGDGAFVFNSGSLFVLGACLCWGFENNCTKMLSHKSSEEIVIIKGCFSGLGSLVVALIVGESIPEVKWILAVLLLGFVAYGLSINFYIMAQKDLGAAKTSAYYSVAPFLGVAFGLVMIPERPALQFYVALAIMVVATVLMTKDTMEAESIVDKNA